MENQRESKWRMDNIGADFDEENGLDIDSGLSRKKRSFRVEDLSTLAVKDLDLSSIETKGESTSDGSLHENNANEAVFESGSFLGKKLEALRNSTGRVFSKRSDLVRTIIWVIIGLLYNVYFVASIHYSIRNGIPMDWCDGVGFLIVFTALIYLGLFYFQVVKKFWGESIYKSVMKPAGDAFDRYWKFRSVSSSFKISFDLMAFVAIRNGVKDQTCLS